ncbi:hypothetical protein CYMTET_21320 [Cymbomonas tetramitiformis]|uniref:Uncharacterized protein n=1 Tax=Cymbomonas tetramitiformis TaxID=36881 RepID=A0AAE0L2Z7_9CHLO|nr:hypothetical protein CYMTET_21320 [Cymbomonas tetramitiformis]
MKVAQKDGEVGLSVGTVESVALLRLEAMGAEHLHEPFTVAEGVVQALSVLVLLRGTDRGGDSQTEASRWNSADVAAGEMKVGLPMRADMRTTGSGSAVPGVRGPPEE